MTTTKPESLRCYCGGVLGPMPHTDSLRCAECWRDLWADEARVLAQRDALLKAAKEALPILEDLDSAREEGDDDEPIAAALRAAIAECEKGVLDDALREALALLEGTDDAQR